MVSSTVVRAIAATSAALLLLTACSSADSTDEQEDDATSSGMTFKDVEPVEEVVELVPTSIKNADTITVAMNLSTPPNKFFAEDGKTPIGTNPDLARLLGRIMGVDNVAIQNVEFDGIIPGLQSGQFDLSIASMGVTDERTAVLDMIDYAAWGSSAVALKDAGISVDRLCGLKVGVQQGSLQQAAVLPELSDQCEQQGEEAIDIVSLPSQQDALTQLTSERLDAAFGDTPVMVYAVSQNSAFELAGDEINPLPVTLATKQDSELTPALLAAMQRVVDMPEYQDIFGAWDLGAVTISEPQKY